MVPTTLISDAFIYVFWRDDAANKSCESHIHSYATQHLGIHVGRYRSYTPWFPTFRIVLRSGRLYLIAPGGVEASDEEEELEFPSKE